MCAQRYTAESDDKNERCRAENANDARMARFQQRQQKKQKLSIKQSGRDRVTAGKTVTGPVHVRAFNKGALPVNRKLQPFVQQHTAGDSNNQHHQRWPESFPNEKQNQRKQNDPDPLPRTKFGKRVQDRHKSRSKTLMKPCRNAMISTPKRIRESRQQSGDREEKRGVYHRKADEV